MGYNTNLMSFVFIFLWLVSDISLVGGSLNIGVCYGMEGDNLPPPKEVISLYKANRINKIRLYEPNGTVLEALRGSNIEVLVGIRNEHIEDLARSYNTTKKWIEQNIRFYYPDVHFKYIAVGNEAIPGPYAQHVLRAMRHFRNAIRFDKDLKHIKVSTVVSTTTSGKFSSPPSSSAFYLGVDNLMRSIAHHLSVTGAPLLANVHPYFTYIKNRKQANLLEYALFLKPPRTVIDIQHLLYWNLFDELVDGLYASLAKVGQTNVSIVVAETGWPSAGNTQFDTARYAHCYLSKLVRHVSLPYGTPAHKRKIETYLYAMFNENKKLGMGDIKDWGLFKPDKKPNLDISFLQS